MHMHNSTLNKGESQMVKIVKRPLRSLFSIPAISESPTSPEAFHEFSETFSEFFEYGTSHWDPPLSRRPLVSTLPNNTVVVFPTCRFHALTTEPGEVCLTLQIQGFAKYGNGDCFVDGSDRVIGGLPEGRIKEPCLGQLEVWQNNNDIKHLMVLFTPTHSDSTYEIAYYLRPTNILITSDWTHSIRNRPLFDKVWLALKPYLAKQS